MHAFIHKYVHRYIRAYILHSEKLIQKTFYFHLQALFRQQLNNLRERMDMTAHSTAPSPFTGWNDKPHTTLTCTCTYKPHPNTYIDEHIRTYVRRYFHILLISS